MRELWKDVVRDVLMLTVIILLAILAVFVVPFYCVTSFLGSNSMKSTECMTVWEYARLKKYVK
jgi:hypothetical protein